MPREPPRPEARFGRGGAFHLNEIAQCEVSAFRVPTDLPESDGTLEWDSTTLVLVRLRSGDIWGLGYTYAHECCVPLIREKLFPLLRSGDALDVRGTWQKMIASVRNLGRRGVAACAIAAVDNALWDLKARRLNVPLVKLLGAVRDKIPVYGSGGFTSYSEQQLCKQLSTWVDEGMNMVKMKVGRDPAEDPVRVEWVRNAVGDAAELFVDANGAYSVKQALTLAQRFSAQNVNWFEEPVNAEDLAGLRFIRERAPLEMEISVGEYDYDLLQARQVLEAQAVDVLQADATRCGITGFLQMVELCDAFSIPLSSHTAPALHAHLCCVAPRARHAEYFHDHVRIEQLFFHGATVRHANGFLQPDLSQPGLGLEFKAADAAKYEIT